MAGGDLVELFADYDRQLRVSDPRGRSLHVSCGAALFNLRLTARATGQRPAVWLLPSPDEEPDLLAAVRLSHVGAPAHRELYDVIDARRTSREPFIERRVEPAVLGELRVAASREGASLVPLDERAAADTLDYAAIAEEALAHDSDYLAELAEWTGREGVPDYVQGPLAKGELDPIRDFGRRTRLQVFEPRPQLAVLTTPGDRPLDWLRAGQALQRVLLTATLHGLSASFLNQPLDLRDMRHRSDPRHRRGHPQMIIRFGYGPHVPRAPRRPVTELELVHV